MKALGIAILSFCLSATICAQAPVKTPAEQKIAWAEAGIKAHPERSQPYNDLAVAYVNRVRETSDARFFTPAEAAVQKSLEMMPGNLEAEKAKIMILLGRGDFAQSFELARALNKKTPDDVLLYGFIADAAIALGQYPAAEEAVQWMLDLRPGNVPALQRGAVLRRLFGDADGAIVFWSQAYQQIPPTQTEELAWTLTQMADLQLSIGRVDEADSLVRSALQKFPSYYLALESAAHVQSARQHYSEALELLRQRNQISPTLASRYELAEALEHAGRAGEADSAYKQFEQSASQQVDALDNANYELVSYYLGRGHDRAEALRIARVEIAKRHDVRALDTYAWALHANSQDQEAQQKIAQALAVGVRDAAMFYHAGAITLNLNDCPSAARFLKSALALNPSEEIARPTRELLEKLAPVSAQARLEK